MRAATSGSVSWYRGVSLNQNKFVMMHYNYVHKFKKAGQQQKEQKKNDAERLSTASGQKLTGIIFFSCISVVVIVISTAAAYE